MGPLQGVRVIEMTGLAPGPFCAMMLADMGAEVIRIDRPGDPAPGAEHNVLARGRRSVAIDLKSPGGRDVCLRLLEQSDALIEGFRPGVMERLGLGPEVVHARVPRLVYGRLTGWGQDGPLAHTAGHDIDYIAISGALHAIGEAGGDPLPPLNLVGDFGGGAMMLAFGMVCALLEARESGRGQVIDAAMSDGAALLMSMTYAMRAQGSWRDRRGANLVDGGAHFYRTYECADGGHLAVGAIEPQFYRQLLALAGLDDEPVFEAPHDPVHWPEAAARLAEVFATRTRDEWVAVFAGSDACVAPVLGLDEAPAHPHNRDRGTFVEAFGVTQPAPAPRFSRTAPALHAPPPLPGEHTREVLGQRGLAESEVEALLAAGAVFQR